MLGLVITGSSWIEPDPSSPIWWTNRFQAWGPGALGFVFLAASFVSLRNWRRAALLFLLSAPIVAFVLAYPSAGYLIWKPDGSGVFEQPFLHTAVELASLFYAAVIGAYFAIRKRNRPLLRILSLLPAIIAIFVFAESRWTLALLPRLAGWTAPFVLFGAFWLATDRFGWPTVFNPGPRPFPRKVAAVFIECLLVGVLLLAGTFAMAAIYSNVNMAIECRGPGLFVKPVRPGHMAFTARLILVGHRVRVSGRWAGDWAVGRVQEQFWGFPPWWPQLVLLVHSTFWEGEPFFISGQPDQGLLTRYLPIVDTMPCLGFAQPVSREEIHLRLLRKPPLPNEARIIGEVRSAKLPSEIRKSLPEDALGMTVNSTYKPLAGARVKVSGSSVNTVVKTDSQGIFEVIGLRPDDYTLSVIDVPANQIAADRRLKKKDFQPGLPVRADFVLDWNGTIEGTVRDASRSPARVYLELQDPAGKLIQSKTVNEDGRFRFEGVSPGLRYLLIANPYGPFKDPYEESPYAPTSQTLEIKPEDPHLRNVDLTVRRLPERSFRARALSISGQPIEGASIFMAYEHTKVWNDVANSPQRWETDRGGLVTIHVFGDVRIRVLARLVDNLKTPPYFAFRDSREVELESVKLPKSLDLVIPSSRTRAAR